MWDRAEEALARALDDKGIPYRVQPGEGAFYGPKHEFVLSDSIGRRWQCGTIQVDFSMPERLDASYVAEDSARRTPVMVHRAILGSLERFIGMLIEDTAGKLPAWLAPSAGGGAHHHRPPRRVRPGGGKKPEKTGLQGGGRLEKTRRSAIKSGNIRCSTYPISWSSVIGR